MQHEHESEVRFVHSQVLKRIGISHGWFMRFGGVSSGLFESLNGKKGAGDNIENVDKNRRRACDTLELNSQKLMHIIHSFETNILVAKRAGEFKNFDASISSREGLVLSQTTADCGTVIIADNVGSVVSLVHGSWHTLRAGIIRDVVAKMKEYTNQPLVAGIGPMICRDCYEFGAEAKGLFDSRYLTPTTQIRHPELVEGSTQATRQIQRQLQNEKTGSYLVDLRQMILDQLRESGVIEIDDLNICTLEDERFFSHRRSGAKSGRGITLASLSQQM